MKTFNLKFSSKLEQTVCKTFLEREKKLPENSEPWLLPTDPNPGWRVFIWSIHVYCRNKLQNKCILAIVLSDKMVKGLHNGRI